MNKTTKYLYPFCSNFGENFLKVYNNYTKVLQIYIGDCKYKNYNNFRDYEEFLGDNIIFVMFDKRDKSFDKSLTYIQTHKNYIADYEIDEYRHIIVFEISEQYKEALKYFKLSKYSKMYTQNDTDKHFSKGSKHFLAKYGMSDQTIHKENCNSLIGTEFNYNQFKLSRYHVLRKSKELRELLECVYNCSIDDNTELIDEIKLEEEVLNYEEHTERSRDLIGNNNMV